MESGLADATIYQHFAEFIPQKLDSDNSMIFTLELIIFHIDLKSMQFSLLLYPPSKIDEGYIYW